MRSSTSSYEICMLKDTSSVFFANKATVPNFFVIFSYLLKIIGKSFVPNDKTLFLKIIFFQALFQKLSLA